MLPRLVPCELVNLDAVHRPSEGKALNVDLLSWKPSPADTGPRDHGFPGKTLTEAIAKNLRRDHHATATAQDQSPKDKADILALLETIHKAYHDKDAAAIVAQYAPEAAVYNLAPPLAHRGTDLQELKTWLKTWEGPVDRESRDFSITVSGDFAFCHGFYRLGGTPKAAGQSISFWMRATVCLLRVGAPGGSSTSTRPCPFTWMAACVPPLTFKP